MTNPKPHIIVASVHRHQYSETFIRDHVNHLPYTVHYFYGGYLPSFTDGRGMLPHWLKPAYSLLTPVIEQRLVKYIRSQNIKLVLAEYGPVGVHLLPVCKAAGIPLVVYFHGYDVTRKAVTDKYAAQYKQLFTEAAALISVSQPLSDRLIALGADADKIIYNPCGVSSARFPFNDISDSEPVLLSVGRFADTKNPQATIKAFANALEQVPDAQLRMAGNGTEYDACNNLIHKLGIRNSVKLLGVLQHNEVYAEMKAARAFVQHSVTTVNGETEGSPVAIMEAGAAGLPVVATRHGGIPAIVKHGETGLLVDEHDIDGMADAMVALLKDVDKATTMGKAAHLRVSEHFSLERNIRILTETIDQYL